MNINTKNKFLNSTSFLNTILKIFFEKDVLLDTPNNITFLETSFFSYLSNCNLKLESSALLKPNFLGDSKYFVDLNENFLLQTPLELSFSQVFFADTSIESNKIIVFSNLN